MHVAEHVCRLFMLCWDYVEPVGGDKIPLYTYLNGHGTILPLSNVCLCIQSVWKIEPVLSKCNVFITVSIHARDGDHK